MRDKRTEHITIRVTPTEKLFLKIYSDLFGMNITSLLIKSAIFFIYFVNNVGMNRDI